eukprot:6748288-Prymnesium_polylepis.1
MARLPNETATELPVARYAKEYVSGRSSGLSSVHCVADITSRVWSATAVGDEIAHVPPKGGRLMVTVTVLLACAACSVKTYVAPGLSTLGRKRSELPTAADVIKGEDRSRTGPESCTQLTVTSRLSAALRSTSVEAGSCLDFASGCIATLGSVPGTSVTWT